jgi:hypothetical protein
MVLLAVAQTLLSKPLSDFSPNRAVALPAMTAIKVPPSADFWRFQ